jgi:hypothetical protein
MLDDWGSQAVAVCFMAVVPFASFFALESVYQKRIFLTSLFLCSFLTQYTNAIAIIALAASASAFAPAATFGVRTSMLYSADMGVGEYDGQLWDNEAKKIIYAKWNPAAARNPMNFNPFETWEGNSPDCSGYYPGEGRYKDPMRGDVSFAIMMSERAEMETRQANPKAGEKAGCTGCRT